MIRTALLIAGLGLCLPAWSADEDLQTPTPPDLSARTEAPAAAASTPADPSAAPKVRSLSHSGEASQHRIRLRAGALNRITFQLQFVDIVLSPDTPLASQPTKLSDNQTVIIELSADAEGEYQAVAQLVDGSLVDLVLEVSPDTPALAWTQPGSLGFEEPAAEVRPPIERREDTWFKEVFYDLVTGEVPEDFTRVRPPSGGQLGALRAEYLAAFRNESYVILVARLHSRAPGWIAEQDLYSPGVKAVLLDGQRLGAEVPPTAYIIVSVD